MFDNSSKRAAGSGSIDAKHNLMIVMDPDCSSFGAYFNSSILLIKICQALTSLGRPNDEIFKISFWIVSGMLASTLITFNLEAK